MTEAGLAQARFPGRRREVQGAGGEWKRSESRENPWPPHISTPASAAAMKVRLYSSANVTKKDLESAVRVPPTQELSVRSALLLRLSGPARQ